MTSYSTKTISRNCYVINAREINGRYRSFDQKSYILDNRTYDTFDQAVRALTKHVRAEYDSKFNTDRSEEKQSYFRTGNGAERDEENFEIELEVVETDHVKIVTEKTMTL